MTRFRILLVDDDPEIRQIFGDPIRAAGYDISLCSSAAEARRLLRPPLAFDLAVIDLELSKVPPGDRSGLEIAKSIDGEIPVVLLSSVMKVPDVVDINLHHGRKGGSPIKAFEKMYGPERLVDLIAELIVHRVFVVHGHDEALRSEVVLCLRALGVNPIVLRDTADNGLTIIESLEQHSNVSFAVVLLTPDDYGEKRGVDPARLRARQNVVFEWGFFIGNLGRRNVCALYREDKNFDFPSDYHGVRSIAIDNVGTWRTRIGEALESAKIAVNLQNVRV